MNALGKSSITPDVQRGEEEVEDEGAQLVSEIYCINSC